LVRPFPALFSLLKDQYEPVAVAGQQLQERDILSVRCPPESFIAPTHPFPLYIQMDAGGQHAVMVAAPKAK
jgi:hypothetical protein